ncbi:MAG: sugar phosphate isomerase/epimerase family protein [Vicinamibacterales bacterium]
MKRFGFVVTLLSLVSISLYGRQSGTVQVGYCTRLQGLEQAKAGGFDYAEISASEVAGLADADFEAAVAQAKQAGIPTLNANLFLPGSIHLTGPQPTSPVEQMVYVKKAFSRLSQLGVKILCFGSGGARRVPDGFSKAEAFQQLVAFGKRIGPEAHAAGITVVIEPLRSQESNIINTAVEGFELVKAINDPNFELLIDFYHLASEKEDPSIILQAGSHLKHLHIANPQGRVFPLAWSEYDYAPFFANLRKINYKGRISVEASSPNFATEAPRMIALIRRAFTEGPYTLLASPSSIGLARPVLSATTY